MLVYESAVSAWTAVSPTKADTDALGNILQQFGRKLLAGRACKKTISQPMTQSSQVGSALPVGPVCIVRRLCDASIWRLMSCVPVSVEL